MQYIETAKSLEYYRVTAFKWRNSLSVSEKIVLSFFMAVITGLMAQARFYLPVTPVPFTGQVIAVLLSGVLLGSVYGGLSQVFYVGLGMAGVPWFAGWSAGSFLSPTTGYLFGFILAALFIGWMIDKYKSRQSILKQILILLTGVLIIYASGAFFFLTAFQSNIKTCLSLTVYPFILFDIFKAISVSVIASIIIPKVRN
ncbi:MAG: biotin transporter BioY [Candidatus Aureabacteria bacterium]|nr:biotin transporter BioY [Candidatus Auribacterota bacterium]